ncbi:M15 family metallopeptidase [Spirochaeta dissipatitropha]
MFSGLRSVADRFLIFWLLLLVSSQLSADSTENRTYKDAPDNLQLLTQAYPGAFEIVKRPEQWGVLFPDNTFIPWDEGIEHESYEDLLARPNLKDMFLYSYPAVGNTSGSRTSQPPPENFDPGRIRHEGFFRALYGRSRIEIEEQLEEIYWMPNAGHPDAGTPLQVHSAFDIPERLRRISNRLEQLPEEYLPYLLPPAGTWYWRRIAGTERLSMHSYGIAIDINPALGDYWRWDAEYRYRIRLPLEIVEIFENEGFIWGGRWYHYDSFHFEFRPELLMSR